MLPLCPICSTPMHVRSTRKEKRHFVCVVDGTKTVEPKSQRTLRRGRPLKDAGRPKRIRNSRTVDADAGVRTHRIK